jgi:4-amino-4-deoxy-L-arabinose transferase-like glycosyltransferase
LRRRYPEIVALLAVILGTVLRLADLPSLLLVGDEYHGLELSRQGYARIASSFDSNGSGTALPLLQRICFDLFGAGQWAYRLPAVVGGLAGLFVMYPVSRRLVGSAAAAIAMLALAADPLHVFYSHFSRSYSIATFGCLVPVYALTRASAERPVSGCWLPLVAVSAALIPWVHLSALVCGLGIPAASLWMIRSRRESALLLVRAALIPIALLALQRPYGSQISYAHYLLTCVPFMLMLMAWALVRGARKLLLSSRTADALAITAGALLVAVAFWDARWDGITPMTARSPTATSACSPSRASTFPSTERPTSTQSSPQRTATCGSSKRRPS